MSTSTPTREGFDLLVTKTREYAEKYMSSNDFDASHDFSHIERVFDNAERILEVELRIHPNVRYNNIKVYLAALLHDVEDSKYVPLSFKEHTQSTAGPQNFLLSIGCPSELAEGVQQVINAVSYSTEVKSPRLVQRTMAAHPELAIVQDADRLDALGAIGIGRAFTYGAVKDKTRGIEGTLKHLDDKLIGLQYLMKTEEGKRLAEIKTKRLMIFKEWWQEEVGNTT